MAMPLDVLIPTYGRGTALAVTLTSLCAQTWPSFRVVVSDQTEPPVFAGTPELCAVVRLLEAEGRPVRLLHHVPRRGMAEQRQFLLDQAEAPRVLFLDDDLILEPDVIARMLAAIDEEDCGLVGCGLIGLSFSGQVRPHEQTVEYWQGPVRPEEIRPDTPQWQRFRLHNAANLLHLQERLGLWPYPRRPLDEDPLRAADGSTGRPQSHKYKVAWIGGCVMYDTAKLRKAGGFEFWRQLPPEHCGEDVLAQLRVIARHGGCGLLPSGVYHQELPTTIANRGIDAPKVLSGALTAVALDCTEGGGDRPTEEN